MLNMTSPRASVLIATHERPAELKRLLSQLATQTVTPDQFEVIVVDDGSREPLDLGDFETPYRLAVLRQRNAGPAVARHRAAESACGEVLIIVDDDMQVRPQFLESHLRAHPPGAKRATIGAIEPDPDTGKLPLLEQWNAQRLLRNSQIAATNTNLRGNSIWTGNLSLRRVDYFAVGGFDLSLQQSEDAELGLRLEQAGVEIGFAENAEVIHCSGHADAKWLRRARAYGMIDRRIAKKHGRSVHADPWRYYYELPIIARPMLALEVAAPRFGSHVARALLAVGQLLLRVGARKSAIRIASLVFAAEYIGGVREEEGSGAQARRSRRSFLAQAAAQPLLPRGVPRRRAHWYRMRADLVADRDLRDHYSRKYGREIVGSAIKEFVFKIGVQMMVAIRLMVFFRDAGYPILARSCSRLIRHFYGSDIHWDSEWAPGVALNHGFGLAVSHAAKIGPGCILFQNLTLGMGMDAKTRVAGAPHLVRDVHIGPNATLIGPIVVGAGTKVMAGALLTVSTPAGSLVETPAAVVRPRQPISPNVLEEGTAGRASSVR